MAVAASELVMIGSGDAQSSKIDPEDATTVKPGTNTSFGSLKQIDAGVLEVVGRQRLPEERFLHLMRMGQAGTPMGVSAGHPFSPSLP